MQATFLNRLGRWSSRIAGLMTVVALGPVVPLATGVFATPSVVVAQEAAGDDVIVLLNGKKITGKILSETATEITFKFVTAGIPATTTYKKSELLSFSKGTGAAPANPGSNTPGSTTPAGPTTTKPEVLASASDPGGVAKKKVYIAELSGVFAEDITQTPMRLVVKDAKKSNADYLIFVLDNDWSYKRWGQKAEIDDAEGEFDQLWRAEDMAPVFNEELRREWANPPTVVFWVKKAMGGAAFLPLSCPNIYFHSDGKIGGIGGLNRQFTSGDKVVWEKQISLRVAHAEGLAIMGGYEPRLIKALCRDEFVLSYKIEGGKPVFLERMPQSPDEFLLTDDGQEKNADTMEQLARGEGNDCLTMNAKVAFELGVSKGTVDTIDDLIFKLGIARNHEKVGEKTSKRITKGWSDDVSDSKRKLRRLWQDFREVRIADPGEYPQRTQARNKQKNIIEEMQKLLEKYKEAVNPRAVPCPSWAQLNLRKETLKTEQMADKPERR